MAGGPALGVRPKAVWDYGDHDDGRSGGFRDKRRVRGLAARPATGQRYPGGYLVMEPDRLENWQKVKAALEAAGKTNTDIYRRACAVLRGANPDLLPPGSGRRAGGF